MIKKVRIFLMAAVLFSCSREGGGEFITGTVEKEARQTPVATLDEPNQSEEQESDSDNSVTGESVSTQEKRTTALPRFYEDEVYDSVVIKDIPRLPGGFPGMVVTGEGACLVPKNDFRLIHDAGEEAPAVYGTLDQLLYRESDNKTSIPIGTFLPLLGKIVYDTEKEIDLKDQGSAYNLEYREEDWEDKLVFEDIPGYFYLTEYQGIIAYIWGGDVSGQNNSERELRELYYQINREEYSYEYFNTFNAAPLDADEYTGLSRHYIYWQRGEDGETGVLDTYQKLASYKGNDLYLTTDLFYEVWAASFGQFKDNFTKKVSVPLYTRLVERILQVLGEMSISGSDLFPSEMTTALDTLRTYFMVPEALLSQSGNLAELSEEDWDQILVDYPESVANDIRYILGFRQDNLSLVLRKRLPQRSWFIEDKEDFSGRELCERWFSIPLAMDAFPDSFGREVLFLLHVAKNDFGFRELWDKSAKVFAFFNGCDTDRQFYTDIIENSVELGPDMIFIPGKRLPVLEMIITTSERYKQNEGFYFLGNEQIFRELESDPLITAAAVGIPQAESLLESEIMAFPGREEKWRRFSKLLPEEREDIRNILDLKLRIMKETGTFISGNKGIFNRMPAWRSRSLYSALAFFSESPPTIDFISENELSEKNKNSREEKTVIEFPESFEFPIHYIEPNSAFFSSLEQFNQRILAFLQAFDGDFDSEEQLFYRWNSILAFVSEIIVKQENDIPVTHEQNEKIAALPGLLASLISLEENQKLVAGSPPSQVLVLLDDEQGGKRVAGGVISGYSERGEIFDGPDDYFRQRAFLLYH